jgi:hypothetical protein
MNRIHWPNAIGRRVRAGVSALLTMLGVIALASTLAAQGTSSLIGASESDALKSIANVIQARSDRAHIYLDQIGYTPTMPEQTWKAFPTIRKLETAFLDYQRGGERGGHAMLAMLSKALAQEYEAVRYEPSLKTFLAYEAPLPKPVPPTTPAPALGLLPEERSAILAVSKYAEGGALGGSHGVLRHHFGLSDLQAYEILRTSSTDEEALLRGFNALSPTVRTRRLQDLATTLQDTYQAARAEPAITRLATAPPPSERGMYPVATAARSRVETSPGAIVEAPRAVIPPKAGGGPGGRPNPTLITQSQGRSAVARSYNGFRVANYGAAEARFARVVASAKGFGGVVFGNVVRGPTTTQPSRVTWIPDDRGNDENVTGRLVFSFTDGVERIMAPVLLEDVFAARAIAFGGVANVPAAGAGEGIGLVGLQDPLVVFDVSDSGRTNLRRRFHVVLHPALADVQLGWSAIYADALPIASELLVQLLREAKAPDAADLLDEYYAFGADVSTWKFTDTPLVVCFNALTLELRPQCTASRLQPAITVRGFSDGDEPAAEFEKAFETIMPVLTRSATAYARLDRFARTLAALRWAKQAGAVFVGSVSEPQQYLVPGSLMVTTHGITPADAFNEEDELATLEEKYRVHLQTLAAGDSNLRAATATLLATLGQRDGARSAVWNGIRRFEAFVDSVGRPEPLIAVRLAGATMAMRQEYSQAESAVRRLREAIDTTESEIARRSLRVRLGIAYRHLDAIELEIAPEILQMESISEPIGGAIDSLSVFDDSVGSNRAALRALVAASPPSVRAQFDSLEQRQADLESLSDRLYEEWDSAADSLDRLDMLAEQRGAARLTTLRTAREVALGRQERPNVGSIEKRALAQELVRLDKQIDSLLNVLAPGRATLKERVDSLDALQDDIDEEAEAIEDEVSTLIERTYPTLERWFSSLEALMYQRNAERSHMKGRLSIWNED